MPPRTKALIAGVVATSIALAALAEGGYSVQARAVIALLTWTAVLTGLLYGLFPRSRPPDAALLVALLLGGLAVLTLGSVAWASDDGAAVEEFVKVGGYLGLFALVVLASREGELRPWIAGVAVGIVAVAALAVVSRLIPSWPGGDEEISQLLPAARGRLSYPIGYWNGLAALLAIGMVLLVWLGAFARALPARAAAAGAIPLLGLGLYLTSSRGGVAALALGLLLLLAVGPRRSPLLVTGLVAGLGSVAAILLAESQPEVVDATRGSVGTIQGIELLVATLVCMLFAGVARAVVDDRLSRLRIRIPRPRVAIAAGAAVLVIAAILANPAQRFEDFKEPPSTPSGNDFIAAHLTSGGSSGRWQFWGEAVDAFASEPLHGLGAGGYAAYWSQHAPIDVQVIHAHSLYLEQLAELGPLALLFILGLLAIGGLRGLLDRHSFADPNAIAALVAVLATGAVSAAIDWTWDIPAVFGPVVIALGLLCGPAPVLAARQALGEEAVPRARLGRGWSLGLAVLGSLILLVAADAFLADRSLERSRDAAADNKLKKAADDARDAIALQPWAAEPRLQLALVQESAGEFSKADDTIREAIERAPNDWHLWLARARIATLDSKLEEADLAFNRARSLNPRDPVFTGLTGPLAP